MTDLAVITDPEWQEIARPDTGELVPLADPLACARALEGIREAKRRLDDARSDFEAALVYHAQNAGTKTLHLDGADVVITGGKVVEYDVTVLVQLLDAGLPQERYDELVTQVVTHKVDARVAKSIEASGNEAYARIVREARREVERPWRVAVK